MSKSTYKPYVLYVAETIYLEIFKIKKDNKPRNVCTMHKKKSNNNPCLFSELGSWI